MSDTDTAIAVGSGDVPVLATPLLVGLCEKATVLALEDRLEPDQTSVGMRVQLEHLQPTKVGEEVRAEALLEKIEGRRLTFTVSAHDEHGLVGVARVTRVVVDRERFLEKLH
ncbi:MAG: hotdog domain-containing protein [Actinomycetota bacterium]|nr:hotdog domain-containing protein [Actinomycetota bacterium]